MFGILLSQSFAYENSDYPTEELYDKPFFSGLFSLSLNDGDIDKDSFPTLKISSGNQVFKPNWATLYRTSTQTLLSQLGILNKANPYNLNTGEYEASFIKIYRITSDNKAVLERVMPISIKREIMFSTEYAYRIDLYNYDLCTYMDRNSNYEPHNFNVADECRFQAGTELNSVYQKELEQQRIHSENVKQWLRDNYDSDYLRSNLPKYKVEIDNLKAQYEDCRSNWYCFDRFSHKLKRDHDEAVVKYNELVSRINRGETMQRKEWDSNLNQISESVEIAKNKVTYYKNIDKVDNSPKYEQKVEDNSYKDSFGFMEVIEEKLDESFKETVKDIDEIPDDKEEFIIYENDKNDSKKPFTQKLGGVILFGLILGILYLPFRFVPILKPYEIFVKYGFPIIFILLILL